MRSVVPQAGAIRQLDRKPSPNEQVTKEDASDPERIARLLNRLIEGQSASERQFSPRTIDHEDRVVDGTGILQHRFPHNFGGRVRWWVVDWQGAQPADLTRVSTTDNNTLVLTSRVSGIVTIRVEEAG